jgi:hypothetical protein
MTRIRLPYVHKFLDRHGKARYYFRRAGFKQVPLPWPPGSREFNEAYQSALANAPRLEIGAARVAAGSVGAVVSAYL